MRLLPFASLLLVLAAMLTACEEPPKPTINLYRAVHIGDLDQIKRHMFWGTDVNMPGPNGDYPLHVAVGQGRVAIVRELLRHGADPNARDALGRTPLHVALANGKVPAVRMLLKEPVDDDLPELLNELVREGAADRDTLDFLVQRGVDINTLGPNGRPPLHLAVASGNVKLAKRLITAGADVNLGDAKGTTPLSLAQNLDDPATAKIMTTLLTQYGAAR